ncbi:MAG: radical SAM protein [Chloroflexota bacterium]|nr:radical SAM protein [Chloroflexota bacterium]
MRVAQIADGIATRVLPLEGDITYGPLLSRRLGRSLGLNLLPTGNKLCSFDCVYCHYGRTDVKTLMPKKGDFPAMRRVLKAVEVALRKYPDVPYLTFSGNGEPTLHPDFPAITAAIRHLRDELGHEVKLAIFSNGTTAHLPHIREALALFDTPILKLDAGDPEALERINRPAPHVKLENILDGLSDVPGCIIQSVLVDGEVSNIRGEIFEAWVAALATIKPTQVQIYSTDYPVPEEGVERVLPYVLKRIAGEVEKRTGLQVRAYWF